MPRFKEQWINQRFCPPIAVAITITITITTITTIIITIPIIITIIIPEVRTLPSLA